MRIDEHINELNAASYATAGAAGRYQGWNELFEGERQLIEKYRSAFQGRVLDIAIGAGRTTGSLHPIAKDYIGLDLSPTMVQHARQQYPHLDIREMDMRQVPSMFSGQQFDAILISFNSIDYIPWSDRVPLLTGLRRLLSDGGLLIVSTHSLEHLQRHPVRLWPGSADRPTLASLRHAPLVHAKQWLRLLRWLLKAPRNRLRLKRHERKGEGFAIVNDAGEYFSLLTAYVDDEHQRKQFADAGLRVLDRIGGNRPAGDSFFHYYVTVANPS